MDELLDFLKNNPKECIHRQKCQQAETFHLSGKGEDMPRIFLIFWRLQTQITSIPLFLTGIQAAHTCFLAFNGMSFFAVIDG
jgi:hypothetical protein